MTGAAMEENYKLEKEYKVPVSIFSEAYREFQKKFVYPKNRIFVILFAFMAVVVLCIGVLNVKGTSDTGKYLYYLAFMVFVALAAREWYNPRKLHRNLTESVRALGEPVYKIGVSEKYVDISTVSEDLSDIPDEEKEEVLKDDPLPEKTRLNIDDSFRVMEYEKFFMLIPGTAMLYIIPKEGFSEGDMSIIRELKK